MVYISSYFVAIVAIIISVANGKTLNAPSFIPGIYNLQGLANLASPYTFTFNLPSQDDAGLESWMAANPGKVLSIDELQKYAAPSSANLAAVQNYLKSQGVADSAVSYNVFKNRVTVTSTVAQAAKFFSAEFSNYQVGNGTVTRTKSYNIPDSIANAVDSVSPFTSFIQVRRAAPTPEKMTQDEELAIRSAPNSANCQTAAVTPTCLRQYYGSSSYTPKASASGVTDVLIAGFINQNFATSDFQAFLRKYRPDAANANVKVINAGGGFNINFFLLDSAESQLDTETVVSATYPLTSIYYNYGTTATQGDIFELAIQDILNNYAKYGNPGVYSISYGADESSVTAQQAAALLQSARQITALGTTLVVASGDNGVGGTSGDTCPPFVPTYPSGNPYFLSVGATQGFSPEVAVDTKIAGFYSGAGFSKLYSAPSYQTSAIAAYNPSSKTDASNFNGAGRAYPDISAQGSKYAIQYMGQAATVGGTSASTPTVASIIALINSARRGIGKANLGWINPALYSNAYNASLVKDIPINSGGSYGCKSAAASGFPTANQWDPSTGLGTPLFDGLYNYFVNTYL